MPSPPAFLYGQVGGSECRAIHSTWYATCLSLGEALYGGGSQKRAPREGRLMS